jgi:hypothetical protein
MRNLAILPVLGLAAALLGAPGCGAFHQSFQTSFRQSFMKSCTTQPGTSQPTCGCVVDQLERKNSDQDLMKLAADDDAARKALADAAQTCAHPAPHGGDAAHLAIYVSPYYDSAGPNVRVGAFSAGLASNDEGVFVATIRKMKQQWNRLGFVPLYVGAIRLYDLGYRNESVYWFYTAQYRGRLFATLADPTRMGTMGDPAFELAAAQASFFELAGPGINGYAFGHPNELAGIVERVRRENRTVPNLRAIYPGVAFKSPSRWAGENAELNAGMDKLVAMLQHQGGALRRQREQNGLEARFGALTSKEL